MAGGNPRAGRQKDDYYPTPTTVTRALLSVWKPQSPVVWEPACGCGMMAREIEAAGISVIGTDIADRGYGEPGIDFLSSGKRADCIITNPPFDLAASFIEHAFRIGVSEMALVLKSTYWHAAKRQRIWDAHRPRFVMPLLWRPDFLNRGGPTMEISWVVWTGHSGPTEYRPLARPKGTKDAKKN
jgi:hypothetical protein